MFNLQKKAIQTVGVESAGGGEGGRRPPNMKSGGAKVCFRPPPQ